VSQFAFWEKVGRKSICCGGNHILNQTMRIERSARTDKAGNPFEIGTSRGEDFSSLMEMYLTFSPKPVSQGLPPEDPETCHDWVKMLFNSGINILAWRGGQVIGHVALVPNVEGKSGEFVIFVHQDHRNLGVGTELGRFALEMFRGLGFEIVWLTVRVLNFIAIKLYKHFGFEFCDSDSYERLMVLELRPTEEFYISVAKTPLKE
jgi:GNAT superfamily N-acetyltransferase